MSEAFKRKMFLIKLMEELGEQLGPVPMGNDNSGAIAIAENKGSNAGRVRHVNARVHWIQDVIESNIFVLTKVPTSYMTADVMPKALFMNITLVMQVVSRVRYFLHDTCLVSSIR
jgi:hypothetical protein